MQFITVNTSTTRDVDIQENGVTVFKGGVADNSTEEAWHDFIRGVYQAGIKVGISEATQRVEESLDRGYPKEK